MQENRSLDTIYIGPDDKPRCHWCGAAPEFLDYHDREWGYPVDDDIRLFEKLCLESFQPGLSWRTILNKRESFRAAFQGFDFDRMASFTKKDVERLLQDAVIIRHLGKIEAVINNAARVRELIDAEGSFAAYVWRYQPDPGSLGPSRSASTSLESVALAKELKKRGWKYVGPTTAFAFLQSMGLINDHVEGCIIWAEVARARKTFIRPGA